MSSLNVRVLVVGGEKETLQALRVNPEEAIDSQLRNLLPEGKEGRYVFKGKILRPSETFFACGVKDGDTMHACVVTSPPSGEANTPLVDMAPWEVFAYIALGIFLACLWGFRFQNPGSFDRFSQGSLLFVSILYSLAVLSTVKMRGR